MPDEMNNEGATTLLEGPDLSAVLNPDGTFAENWYEHELVPEDCRGHKSLAVIKSLPDLVKRTVHAEKLIGKSKIALPTEKSKPEEWDALYNALGRPAAPDGYKVEVPDAAKEFYSPERLTATLQALHGLGLTQKQVEGVLKADMEAGLRRLETAQQQREADLTAARQAGETALRQEWGGAYDERLHVANRLVAETFAPQEEEQKLQFLQKFGNDPDFIRFAARNGAKLVEHKALVASYQGTPDAAEIQAKIATLQATPGYLDVGAPMAAEERERITNEIRDLMKQAHPSPART